MTRIAVLMMLAVVAIGFAACANDPALRNDYAREMDGCAHGCDGM